jgi:hypothetical protein
VDLAIDRQVTDKEQSMALDKDACQSRSTHCATAAIWDVVRERVPSTKRAPALRIPKLRKGTLLPVPATAAPAHSTGPCFPTRPFSGTTALTL